MDVKVKSEAVLVKSENVAVKVANESVSVCGNLNVKLVVHGTVVEAVESAPLLLALVDPKTGFCHGVEEIDKEKKEFVNRRVVAGSRRTKFYCELCNYCSREKYLLTRHTAKVHKKTTNKKRCNFCDFSTLYASNLKRHIQRAHRNHDSSVISCHQVFDSSS